MSARLEGDERGISAGLVLDRNGGELLIPCHPADALALAVRAHAPIVAEDSALAHARAAGASPTSDAMRDWLDRVRPADFAGP